MPFLLSQDAADDLTALRNHWRSFAREQLGGGFSPAVHNSRIVEYVEVGDLLDEDFGLYDGTVQALNADGLTWETVSDTIYIINVALDPDDSDHKPFLLTTGDLHIGLRFGTYQDVPVFAVDNCCGGKCREEAQCHNCNLLIWRFCGKQIFLKQSFDGCCCSGSGSGGSGGSGSGCNLCPTDNIPLRVGVYINGIGAPTNLPDECVSEITGGGGKHEDVCLVYQGIVNCNHFSTPFANCQWWTANSSAVGQIDLFSPECSGAWILKVGQNYFLPWSWIYAPCSCQFFGYYYPPNSANGNGVVAYSFQMCDGDGCGSGSGTNYNCWDCGGLLYCSSADLTSNGCTVVSGPYYDYPTCQANCGSGSGSGPLWCCWGMRDNFGGCFSHFCSQADLNGQPTYCAGPCAPDQSGCEALCDYGDEYYCWARVSDNSLTCAQSPPQSDSYQYSGPYDTLGDCQAGCGGSGSGSGSGPQYWCVSVQGCDNFCSSCSDPSYDCMTNFPNGPISGVGDSTCVGTESQTGATLYTVVGGPYSDNSSCEAVCGAGSGSGSG